MVSFRFLPSLQVLAASLLAALPASIPASATADGYVPPLSCAIIVASRQTMSEVDAFVAANPQIEFGRVYASRNGWLAISAGLVDEDIADAQLT